MKSFVRIMGYNIFIGRIDDIIKYPGKIIINTINPHSYCVANRDPVFKKALNESDLLLPDGIGIVLATFFLEGRRIQQISGPNLHPKILGELNKQSSSCFYLGSNEETLKLIKTRIELEYPSIRVGYYSPPYKDNFTDEDNIQMIESINNFDPDVLFVGMTAPKQEKWVFRNHSFLNVRVICSIGAVFDFYAGTVRLPPSIFFKLGIGWLIRFIGEPKRLWKRNMISMPIFFFEMILYKIRIKS